MAKNVFLISFMFDRLRVWAIPKTSSADSVLVFDQTVEEPDQTAGDVLRAMQQNGYRNEPVVVGLDSYQVLALPTPLELDRTTTSDGLKYSLEEHCPVDAENIAAIIRGNLTLIAIRDQIEPFTSALLDIGVRIQCVVPNAIMVYDSLEKDDKLADESLLLIDNMQRYDFLAHSNGSLHHWSIIHGFETFTKELEQFDDEESSQLVLVSDNPPSSDKVGPQIETISGLTKLFCEQARNILVNQAEPSVNFVDQCCGDDAIHPLKAAIDYVLVAGILLVVLLAGALYIRTAQTQKIIKNTDQRLAQLVNEAIPGHPKTRLVKRTLLAEKERLVRQGNLSQEIRESRKLSETIFQFLQSVPVDLRFELDTITLDSKQIAIQGRTINQNDYEQFKTSLGRDLKLETIGPVTSSENNVAFELTYGVQDPNEESK